LKQINQINSGFAINRENMILAIAIPKTIHMGVFPSSSANTGAVIVTVLEKTLQIPIDVEQKSVGNSNSFERKQM